MTAMSLMILYIILIVHSLSQQAFFVHTAMPHINVHPHHVSCLRIRKTSSFIHRTSETESPTSHAGITAMRSLVQPACNTLTNFRGRLVGNKSLLSRRTAAKVIPRLRLPPHHHKKHHLRTTSMTSENGEPDYAQWTHAELLQRVTDLEQQLRAQNTQHTATPTALTSSSPVPPPRKKQKKVAKPFQPDKYNTRLIALKFAYLGGNYNGFEHHANNRTPLPTIEEEIWRALKKTRLILPTAASGSRDANGEEEVSWEGCEYSKCGRTDRGVSAFGQVIGVRVRSNRPKQVKRQAPAAEEGAREEADAEMEEDRTVEPAFDPITDELPYIQIINRVLPPDIRILAWCPDPPPDFSARFNCKERRYRYFFSNPAYIPLPGIKGVRGSGAAVGGPAEDGWLDIEAMSQAAKKYQGLHDFRNFCKVDPGKQITNFERRIFHAGIHEVRPTAVEASPAEDQRAVMTPKLYYFEVRGSAFLWHQVRHLVAMLFLVGQGYEEPSIIDDLLDVQKTPAKPMYDMASDVPLVLWDCIFPSAEAVGLADHSAGEALSASGYEDAMNWVYVGDENGGRDRGRRPAAASEDGKHGRNGVMEELWALWRKRKMDEILAWNLMELVATQGERPKMAHLQELANDEERSARIFDGSEVPRTVGKYVPVMQRDRMEEPDVVNARYAARKGLTSAPDNSTIQDGDE